MMALKRMSIIERYPILCKLDAEFAEQIKLFHVFGCYGTLALIVTLDDSVYTFDSIESECLGPKQLKPIKKMCNKNVIKFATGFSNFVIALTMNGSVYSWGYNSCGQLGNGNAINCNKPQLIQGLRDVIDVCCGGNHSLALTFSGEVYAFGSNSNGQIGNGCRDNQLTPIKLNSFGDEKVIAISCGLEHSLALTENGRLFGWGSNKFGQLGTKAFDDQLIPIKLSPDKLKFINKIVCGKYNSLLLSSNCDLFIYGSKKIIANVNPKSSKYLDVGASIYSPNIIGITQGFGCIVWNENASEILRKQALRENTSTNEAFALHSSVKITLNNVWLTDSCSSLQKYEQFINGHGFSKYKIKFSEIKTFNGGAFGDISKVICRTDSKIYAIKVCDKSSSLTGNKMNKELEIIKQLNCDNIVKYYDFWCETIGDPSGRCTQFTFIQMEYCKKQLKNVIKEMYNNSVKDDNNMFKLLSYVIACELFIEILDGVNYLHKHNPPIIHLNLNTKNILIANSYNRNFIKICSFGFARFEDSSIDDKSIIIALQAIDSLAPEVAIDRHYDTKADVYSLGLIMQKLFNLEINLSNYTISFLSLMNDNSAKYLNACATLLKLLSPQAKNRPNCEQILKEKHLWALSYDEIKSDDENAYENLIKKTAEKSFFRYFIETKVKRNNQSPAALLWFKELTNEIIDESENKSILSTKNNTHLYDIKYDNYLKKFIELGPLGCGGFGAVFKAQNMSDSKLYAIKKIPVSDNNDAIADALNELRFLSQLKCEFIVQCVDHWIEDNYYIDTDKASEYFSDTMQSGNTRLFMPHFPKLMHIQMQLCSHTLKTIINEYLSEEYFDRKTQTLTPIGYYMSSELFFEILECVNYIHTQNPPIIHHDLKPDNILILLYSGSDGRNRFVKLGDFGLATIHNFADKSHTAMRGTVQYMAPEVVNSRAYDTKADIFCVGMIAQQLFVIDINKSTDKTVAVLLNEKIVSLVKLINKLLSPKTSERLNCEQMLSEKSMWSLSVEELKSLCNFNTITTCLSQANSISDNFCKYFLNSKINSQ